MFKNKKLFGNKRSFLITNYNQKYFNIRFLNTKEDIANLYNEHEKLDKISIKKDINSYKLKLTNFYWITSIGMQFLTYSVNIRTLNDLPYLSSLLSDGIIHNSMVFPILYGLTNLYFSARYGYLMSKHSKIIDDRHLLSAKITKEQEKFIISLQDEERRVNSACKFSV